MRNDHPKADAISYQQKQQPGALPRLADFHNGGVLDSNPGSRLHHAGMLPDLRNVEHLPPTELPLEVQTYRETRAMDAIAEGHTGSLAAEASCDEPFAPPVDVSWGGESPAELGYDGQSFAEEQLD